MEPEAPRAQVRWLEYRGPGRPRVDRAIEELIVLMAEENLSWPYDRVVGRWPIWDLRSPTKRGEMFCAPRRAARAGAQAHDQMAGLHSGPPGAVGGDRLFTALY